MKELLIEISHLAIQLADPNIIFTEDQKKSKWLGNPPANDNEIELAELRLNVKFPDDFKKFLRICNGFSAPTDIEPSFEELAEINFLKVINPFLIEVWTNESSSKDFNETGEELSRSILIAGIKEEQYFLLIPPFAGNGKWKYWKFASWQAGEHAFENLEDYFKNVLDFIKNLHDNSNFKIQCFT